MSENDRFCPPNCPRRELGCHSSCERYKEKCAENEKRKANKRRDNDYRGFREDLRVKIYKRVKHDRRPRQKSE